MLVISRKSNEAVLIWTKEGQIRFVVAAMEKGRVRLGIEAPRGCTIVREELLLEIKGANRMSAARNLEEIRMAIAGEQSE